MPIPRLRRDSVALLVIDVQERLLPTIHSGPALTHNCAALLDIAAELAVPAIVTEQYVKGLGRTVPEVAAKIRPGTAIVEKTRFSGAVKPVIDELERTRRSSVLVCGIEAHVCVLQTTLDLLAAGRQVFLASDAISAGAPDQVPYALARMESGGAIVTGALSATYELLADAADPHFKACLATVKSLRTLAHAR